MKAENEQNSNEFIDLKGVAKMLGLKPGYIYKLVNQRKLQHYKPFGKKLYFKRSEVNELIESGKVDN